MAAQSLEELAHDAASRALDKQEAVLAEIRARTGALLAASALAASFLGREAFREPAAWLAAVALLGFVVSVGSSVFILLPRKEQFTFALCGPALYEGLYAIRDDIGEIHRRLTYELRRLWGVNDDRLQPLFWAYRLGAAALVIEIVALVVLVSGNLNA